MAVPPSFSEEDIASLDECEAQEVLRWASDRFGDGIALASSFGVEDCVIIDMLARLGEPRVFTLDTGRLPQETYDVMDAVQSRYGIRVEVFSPDAASVRAMVRDHGFNLFYRSVELRRQCCYVRKVEPLERALAGLDAWITGLRRDQEPSRRAIRKVELDSLHGGLTKVNPLADWTSDDVWAFIREHRVPYNRLHDLGYSSVGCAPCTRAVAPGEDARAGRWWWERDTIKECGLHGDPIAGPIGTRTDGGE